MYGKSLNNGLTSHCGAIVWSIDAATAGDIKTLEELLAKGARINDTDNEGYSALMMATKHGQYDCVEFLLNSSADVDQRDSDGFSALHEAAFRGLDDIARLLLRWGANKQFITSEGTTALQLAVRHGHGVIAYMLCDGHSVEKDASSPSVKELQYEMNMHDECGGEDHGGIDIDTSVNGTVAMAAIVPSNRCWRFSLHIAYLGSGFVGWQRQIEKSACGKSSVQELVEDVITELLKADKRVNVTSVSRTDAGTHALYQYGSIRLDAELPMPLDKFKALINAKLPDSVVLHSITTLDPSVKPKRVKSYYKKYIYYIQQGSRPDLEQGKYSWFLGRKIDPQQLRDALSYIVGEHDFRPLSQGLQKAEFAELSTVRTLLSARVRIRKSVQFSLDPAVCGVGDIVDDEAAFLQQSGVVPTPTSTAEQSDQKKRRVETPLVPVYYICVELVANGFLRHMVRRILGTLRPIGEGTYPPSRMRQVLDGELEPGPSAPSKGLWLHRTWLTQEDWDADDSRDD